MTDRLSLAQVVMAAAIAGLLLSVGGGVLFYALSGFRDLARAGPVIFGMLLAIIPLAGCNIAAWTVMRMTAGGLPSLTYHLVLGAVAAVLLVALFDLTMRSMATMGGRPTGLRDMSILATIGAVNLLVVFVTWRFNIQPQGY